jgi:GNAT superfamily N-acetyltransferase
MMESFYREGSFPWHEGVARALERLLEDPALGRVYLIEHDGTEVGYVAICFGFSLEFQGRDGFVDEIFVVPEARRKGIARAALEHAIELSGRLGVRALHLEAAKGNAHLLRLYASLGFRERPHPFLTRVLVPPRE